MFTHRVFFCAIAFALLLLIPGTRSVAADPEYLKELQTRARELRLAEKREWQVLLHYRRSLLTGRVRSLADDSGFFNAKHGKTRPQEELDATLAAFFSELAETDAQQNPQCRFIARFRWLQEQLKFDPARMPQAPCDRFNRWRATLDTESATLIFPSAYVNSPASMYGHTLLRIGRNESDSGTQLLGYAVNYAAFTQETNGIIFAIKGVFGGYPGRFSMTPYYKKVSEYNDLENRDIWEYELSLTPIEIDRLLRHVWELGPVNFDYFFFDENCSYQLLFLLDAARPSLRLNDQFPLWAIPADTVRVVTAAPNLVRNTRYRASRATQLKYSAAQTPAADIDLAKSIASGTTAPTRDWKKAKNDAAQARVLDLAYDYLDYQRVAGKMKGEQTVTRLRDLLVARAQVDAPPPAEPPAPSVRPDQGHASARVSLGGGTTGGDGFQELRFRATYHDLLDPRPGYQPGAQIEFGNFYLRHENDRGAPFVERATFVNVTSIAERSELIKPLSWRMDFGLERTRFTDGTRPLLFQFGGGAGLATELFRNATGYAMLEAGTLISPKLDSNITLGVGPSAGLIVEPMPRWRLQLFARSLHYVTGSDDRRDMLGLHQNIMLNDKFAIRIEADTRREFGVRWSTFGAFGQYYF